QDCLEFLRPRLDALARFCDLLGLAGIVGLALIAAEQFAQRHAFVLAVDFDGELLRFGRLLWFRRLFRHVFRNLGLRVGHFRVWRGLVVLVGVGTRLLEKGVHQVGFVGDCPEIGVLLGHGLLLFVLG